MHVAFSELFVTLHPNDGDVDVPEMSSRFSPTDWASFPSVFQLVQPRAWNEPSVEDQCPGADR